MSKAAIKEYARQTKNRQLEIDAAEIRMRGERRLGEMLTEQKKDGGLNKGRILRGTKEEPRENTPKLSDFGIDKNLSSRAQKLAQMPKEKHEGVISKWRAAFSYPYLSQKHMFLVHMKI